jgi:hypothetical protein
VQQAKHLQSLAQAQPAQYLSSDFLGGLQAAPTCEQGYSYASMQHQPSQNICMDDINEIVRAFKTTPR